MTQDRNGDTALHVAAADDDDRLETVLTLTRLGADAAATNKSGHTALCVAAQGGTSIDSGCFSGYFSGRFLPYSMRNGITYSM